MSKVRTLLFVLLVAGVTAGVAGAGADKFALLGPDGNAWCDGSGVIAGTDGGYGFAVVNSAGGKVSATVSLKKQEPNTVYQIRLIQGISDCFTFDATVTTNGQGNGTVHLSEAATSSAAFVAVDGGGDAFVTETHNH